MHKRIAIYPGTFDPITNGHIDIILRASKLVDKLIIGISTAFTKQPLFSIEERYEMIATYLAEKKLEKKIEVRTFPGLLVHFAHEQEANIIIRGIRAVSDFEYEFQMSCMNSRLAPDVDTILLPASEEHQFVSSRLVKEIASLGGDISSFVIPGIESKIYAALGKNKL